VIAQTACRPAKDEYFEYYGIYIDRVSGGDILQTLEDQIAEFTAVLSSVAQEQAGVLHKPYTWTIKQVVGHLIDVEKVFGYRAHRFACNDLRPILGMEQNEFVAGLDYERPSLDDFCQELKKKDRTVLELAATRVYLEREDNLKGDELDAELKLLKGHLFARLDDANELVADLKRRTILP
jgi:hypothetical protein